MAEISKSANLEFYLEGVKAFPPTEWSDISIKATFEDEVQASIEIEKFTFILDAYKRLREHIDGGLTTGVGIFEGVPFQIIAQSINNNLDVFDGFVDLQDEAVINDTERYIDANIKQLGGLDTLNDKLAAISYDFLYEKGVVTDSDFSDIPYVVQPLDSVVQAMIASLTLFSLLQSIRSAQRDVSDSIATISSLASDPLGGQASSIVYSIAISILNIAYLVALSLRAIELTRDIINLLAPPKRTHKGILIKTALEKAANYLGYGFNTSITQLDFEYYLPSNPNYDEEDNRGFIKKVKGTQKGIPRVGDYGFICEEMFQLVKRKYNARYAIINNVIECHTELSPFWEKLSTWNFPNAIEGGVQEFSFNTEELNSNLLISYVTDPSDGYTLNNFTGTNYQIITDAQKINDERKKTIVNLLEVRIPVALGNRKNELTGLQKVLREIARFADSLTGILNTLSFGAINKTNFASGFDNQIGALIVDTNNHLVPKNIWLENEKIPTDHREKLSAKASYEIGYFEKSFIENAGRRQRKVYSEYEIPFGFEDFLKVIENGYFPNFNGNKGKVLSLNWNIYSDKAKISFYTEQVYTKNLVQIFIEP